MLYEATTPDVLFGTICGLGLGVFGLVTLLAIMWGMNKFNGR